MGKRVGGRSKRERIHTHINTHTHTHTHTRVYIYVADSVYSTAETNRTLQSNYVCREAASVVVQLLPIIPTVARQAPLSMGCSMQEYRSRLPFPPPGHLPNSGTESPSLMSPALAGGFFTTSATWEAPKSHYTLI